MSAKELEELLTRARCEDDDNRRDELLISATRAGPQRVRAIAERMLVSEDDEDIILGADLVSAMPQAMTSEALAHWSARGWPVSDVVPFEEEDRRALAGLLAPTLLAAQKPEVVWACLIAAGKLERPELLDAVLHHVPDQDADVREGCARVLANVEPDGPSARAVAALVTLGRDPVDEVREWALFALGGGRIDPIDTPETRALFRENIEDPHEAVRTEAIEALGLLGDVEMLACALRREDIGSEAVEVARRLADSRLHAPLVHLRENGWASANDPEVTADLEALLSAAIDASMTGESPSS